MTDIFRNRIKTVLASSFLVLFLGYYASISFFYHSHLVLGDTVVHSHPYKAGSNGKPFHSHSDKGYITIQLLSSSLVTTLLVIFTLAAILPVIYKIVSDLSEGILINSHHFHYSLRGPPQTVLN